MEGNSATLTDLGVLGDCFNPPSSNLVRKDFKPFSGEGFSTLPDFENEVHVLQLLQKYSRGFSFQIPQVTQAQINDAATDEGAPVASIWMTKLSGSLMAVDVNALTLAQKISHARAAAQALAQLHGISLSSEEKSAIPCSPLRFNLAWLATHDKSTEDAAIAKQLSIALQAMHGEEVFIHNDFHHRNLFA